MDKLTIASRIKLRQTIAESFSDEDLSVLCFDLGISPDNLAGRTLTAKTANLILYFEQRFTIKDLIVACESHRSNIDWQVIAQFDTSNQIKVDATIHEQKLASPSDENILQEPQEELGFIDYLVEIETRMLNLTKISHEIQSNMVFVSQEFAEKFNRINVNHNNTQKISSNEVNRILNEVALFFDRTALTLNTQFEPLITGSIGIIKGLTEAAMFIPEISNNKMQDFYVAYSALDNISNLITSTVSPVDDLRSNISSLPRLSGNFIKAKRRFIDAMDSLTRKSQEAFTQIQTSRNLLKELEKQLLLKSS